MTILRFTMIVSLVLLLSPAASAALAEFQCAPEETNVTLPESDPFFVSEQKAWASVIRSRYLEGDGNCVAVQVPGYEGFPTMRCSYSSVDAGKGKFDALSAQVIVLDPSSRQLAAWSIHACRATGAADAKMQKCLDLLRSYVVHQNGAQFPVVGSVVESYCNSSSKLPSCAKGPLKDLRPRNTWFRDGVSIDYVDAQAVHWDDKAYSQVTFDAVLDVAQSDPNLRCTYELSRVAGATRANWAAWRKHLGKSEMLDADVGTIVGPYCGDVSSGRNWRAVSGAVHRAACKGSSNEMFDAVVFANPSWTGTRVH